MAERVCRVLAERVGGSDFEFVGGYWWVDFINTELVEKERVVELLGSFEDVIVWLEQVGVLGLEEAGAALERWDGTEEGERLLVNAREFRKILRGAAERFARNEPVEPEFVQEINALLRSRLGHPELAETEEGFEVRFRSEPDGSYGLLAPVAESAARFISEADRALLKACENPGCILFFYDSTKNHRRRWCSMESCGNRMKAKAHYERSRSRIQERETRQEAPENSSEA